MRLRSLGFVAVLAAALVPSCQPACVPPPAPPPPPPVGLTSIVVDGQGSGHGRGLSAWGSYGWAVTYGSSWQQILDHYYSNTGWGGVANTPIRVRLMALDDAEATGVISIGSAAMWNGLGYAALQAWEVAHNTYNVYGSATPQCPGGSEGWALLAEGVTGPVTFTTPLDETSTAAGDVLGLCQPNGAVVHYRGSISVLNDATGANRTVNEVLLENYLRGVVPREVPASWGNAGGGAGMNALWAFSVAARSFAMSQGRYSYARTCDTTSCQVYGGAAHRANPSTDATEREHANTNRAVAETAGWVRVWPDGRVVSTEYSASHGPRNAGGPFPAVDDPADNVPQNPNHRWARTLDANAVAATYGLGQLTAAWTERDPNTPYDGIWGNRVQLQGTAGSVTVSAWDFRNALGLPSPGFVISSVA